MYQVLAFVGRNWPFRHGTGWLVERPSRWIKHWSKDVQFYLKDGRILQGDLNDSLFRSLYLYGVYEPVVTTALSRLVKPGDTVIDVGANIGVITALLGRLIGPQGKLFSFEPVPAQYEKLKQTILLNGLDSTVKVYNQVVSDGHQAREVIYVPQGHSHACSSMRLDDLLSVKSFDCEATSLDTVFLHQPEEIPTLIKVDVEGAEMLVLHGAGQLCLTKYPPIWVLEVNQRAAARFGYQPENLAAWLADRHYDHFYYSNERTCSLYQPGDAFRQDGTLYALHEWAIQDGRILNIK